MPELDDVTGNLGKVYATLDRVFRDANNLATDFKGVLEAAGYAFATTSEYSYSSPYALVLKANHAWVFADGEDTKPAAERTFAAVIVVFKSSSDVRKLANSARPEAWFVLGRGSGANAGESIRAPKLRGLFKWEGDFVPEIEMGGPVSTFRYEDSAEAWRIVCLGRELGAIGSFGDLEATIAQPILAEAAKNEIFPSTQA